MAQRSSIIAGGLVAAALLAGGAIYFLSNPAGQDIDVEEASPTPTIPLGDRSTIDQPIAQQPPEQEQPLIAPEAPVADDTRGIQTTAETGASEVLMVSALVAILASVFGFRLVFSWIARS